MVQKLYENNYIKNNYKNKQENMNESEEKLAFLLAGSCNTLPESCIKLRSYLSIHSSNVAAQHGLILPRYFTNKNITCPFCYTPWKFNTNSLKLLPSSGKKFKLDLTSANKKSEEEIKCSKNISEESFHTRNKLVLKCKVCTRKSCFSLMKPQKKNENQIDDNKSSFKKKKKKKNKYANLNIEACKAAKMALDISKNNENNNNKNKRNKKNNKKEKNKLSSVTSIQNKTENQKISNKSVSEVKPSTMSCTKLKSPQGNGKNKLNSTENKKLLPNPYHKKNEKPDFKSKRKQLALIKRALKEEKTPPKSSIRDFLNVISN